MENYNDLLPKPENLKANNDIYQAPYSVLSMFAEAIYNAYDQKLMGMVTARNFARPNGDKYNFSYGLYLFQVKNGNEGAQLKIMELSVTDDGWYPCTLYLVKPEVVQFGEAKTESELLILLKQAANTDFVKTQIRYLLNG